jgi:hypothetical protein
LISIVRRLTRHQLTEKWGQKLLVGKVEPQKNPEKKKIVEKIERYSYNPRLKHRYLPRRRLTGHPDSKLTSYCFTLI